MQKTLSFLVGVGALAFVFFLGIKTRNDPALVVWFGLASAIIAPIGFAAIGYAFTASKRQVLEQLSKVPEIEKLIDAAKTQEEKIQLLERERLHLAEVVELEARKQFLVTQQESLERDGIRILKELELVEAEMAELGNDSQSTLASEEIKRLQTRLQARRRGDIIFRRGSSYFTIRRETLLSWPYGGVVFDYLKFAAVINNNLHALAERGLGSNKVVSDKNGVSAPEARPSKNR